MVRKELVEKIFSESLKPPKHGGQNPFGGFDLTDDEWDYLDEIADNYDYSKETTPIYEH